MATAGEDPSTVESVRERWKPRFQRFRRGWDRFSAHLMGPAGLVILVVFSLWALFPSVFAPHTPGWTAYLGTESGRLTLAQVQSLPHPPTWGAVGEHRHPAMTDATGTVTHNFFAPLGTNDQGKDIATNVVYSASTGLYIGFAAGILSSLVGVPLGLISGFYGDTWIDEAIQRVADIILTLPFLPLIIVLVAIRGVSTTNIILAIVVKSWVNNCIIIRGETLSLKELSYVDSAKVAGASDTRIIFRHILPQIVPLGFIYLAQDAAAAILTQAGLAYLGLADFTNLSWGIMLQRIQGRGYVFDAWWWLIPPGLCIALIAAAFYFVSYSMEDVTNPHTD
jgi:peptide/nickel transport system permease protein